MKEELEDERAGRGHWRNERTGGEGPLRREREIWEERYRKSENNEGRLKEE